MHGPLQVPCDDSPQRMRGDPFWQSPTFAGLMDGSSGNSNRRRFLSVVSLTGVTALAGCSALWQQTGATDVNVYNWASESKVVSVTVTAADAGEAHTDRTLDLDPSERVEGVNQSKLPTNTSYTVDVSVEGGPSETFEWEDPEVTLAPLYVLVDESRNIKFLLQAG